MDYLGRDETKPAPLFIRGISPTEIQQLATEMIRVIKGYYPGIDIINPYLWAAVGVEADNPTGGPVIEFLQRYVDAARTMRKTLTRTSKDYFYEYLYRNFEYEPKRLNDYLEALLDLQAANKIPPAFRNPLSYEPSSLAADIGKPLRNILIAGAIVGGIYVYLNMRTVKRALRFT